ncbi:hypothetical protein [Synechococcus sp. PCC 7336]|uniref:hypothetical protein n=1 Tax=Synechococcus sp. PCC 7336 TaxID=195250 RepID=UPI00034D88E9|nr:hypothetical protein [Synechococcus sp. PCC 7336]
MKPFSPRPNSDLRQSSDKRLQQALAYLDLDAEEELEAFRRWQENRVNSPLGDRQASNISRGGNPPQSTHPQPYFEDLDMEDDSRRGINLFPFVALLSLLAAAAGIGLAFSWLTSPNPQTTRDDRQDSPVVQQPETGLISIPLEELPLIPVSPSETARIRSNPRWQRANDIGPDGEAVANAAGQGTESSEADLFEAGSPTTEQVESQNVAFATPVTPSVDGLGPNLGSGTFLVLMTYQDDGSLARAQQYSQGAFVKQLGDETYVQLAAFEQLEYARHMADNLRRQGVPVLILQ